MKYNGKNEDLKRQRSPAISVSCGCQEMAKINDMADELLVKILSYLPTKVAVSTSILSKQWKFLWMWSPNLEFDCNNGSVRDFINKNLPPHRSPIIKSLRLRCRLGSFEANDSKTWVRIAVSRGLRELSISYYSSFQGKHTMFLFLPSVLYTCNSLVTLNLDGKMVRVHVPPTVCLSSLKKLHLRRVTYTKEDSLRLLLCCCPVLEDLLIDHEDYDNTRMLVIKVPSLLRLSLIVDDQGSAENEYVIVTPSLKYLQVKDYRLYGPYLVEHMPKLEEANISVSQELFLGNFLKSISSVKRLSLSAQLNGIGKESLYGDGIVFSKLNNLKVYIWNDNWSTLIFQLLKDSPNLQVLDLEMVNYNSRIGDYEPDECSNSPSLVPECLMTSLTTFKFKGSSKEEEERNFLSFIIKQACCLKSASITLL